MRLTTIPQEFLDAAHVIEKIEAAGFEAYFVGGSVRDALLGEKIHDVDIATNAYPEEVKQIFRQTVDIGIQHGTVLVLSHGQQYEVTTFRTESAYQDYRRPDKVTFVRSLSEDLKRRDFTINAFAMNRNGEIIDLFDGLADLKSKVIRAVGNASERFHEDALRMLRGLRFASQLDFTIEPRTLEAICLHHALLEKISVERIQVEFEKLMLGQKRSRGLKLLVETECSLYCPGMRRLGAELLRLADFPDTPLLESTPALWTLCLHQFNFQKPEEMGKFLQTWKTSNHLQRQVKACVPALRKRLENFWTIPQLYQLGIENLLLVENLLPMFGKTAKVAETQTAFNQLPIHSLKDLAVNGNDLQKALDKKPGQWLGVTMNYLGESVLAGEVPNRASDLLLAAAKLLEKASI